DGGEIKKEKRKKKSKIRLLALRVFNLPLYSHTVWVSWRKGNSSRSQTNSHVLSVIKALPRRGTNPHLHAQVFQQIFLIAWGPLNCEPNNQAREVPQLTQIIWVYINGSTQPKLS